VRIEFQLARPGAASLRLYDVAGRLVRVLVDERVEAGARAIHWDGRDGAGEPLPAGAYLYELRLDGRVRDTGKAVLLR
jgi:flagellar hook assembly protein FlgD